jgi:hypothetical protein
MRVEDLIMYFGSVATFIAILVLYKTNKKNGVINFVVFFLYSFFFYFSFFFKGNGGSTLIWLFYSIIFTSIHLIAVLLYLIVKK